ncbi:MAG: VWA domain-containing protein [Methylomonas sp.]
MSELHFLRPEWWLALIPLAILLFKLAKHRYGQGQWSEICDAELLPFLLDHKPTAPRYGNLIAGGLAALLAITALAGPTWQRLPSPTFRNDSALVIALNLAPTMDAADIKPSRIAKARYKIADLLKQRKDGQTALLVYGGDPFTVTPLTADTATITSQLEALSTDIMPSPGTNTAAAIEKAKQLLQQAGLPRGHILLITDNAEATDNLDLADYQLSVLAVGTKDGAPIAQANGGFVKDSDGNIVLAKLDVEGLMTLAQKGRGIYQVVTANDDDVSKLGALFNTPAVADENSANQLLLQQWDEKGPWLVLLVLPWAALQFRKGLLLLLLVLLPLPQNSYALDWRSLFENSNQRGATAFQNQDYQQAAEQFNDPNWQAAAQYRAGQFQQAAETLKNSQTADGHYNRGNALAQAGDLQSALQAYQQALKLDPKHQDAQFNKALVEKKLQEQKSEQQPSKDQQQQADSSQSKSEQADKSQSESEHKPADQSQKSDQQQAEQKNQSEEQPSESQPEQPSKPEQKPADEPQKAEAKSDAKASEKLELNQADQQLLKRIPDEPTGLLKRKFKYQYSQGR